MNPQSGLTIIIGVFALNTICFGQRPSCKKPLIHFAADMLKVDSILSAASEPCKKRISNIHLHDIKYNKDRMGIELTMGKSDGEETLCPVISEIKRPNESDE